MLHIVHETFVVVSKHRIDNNTLYMHTDNIHTNINNMHSYYVNGVFVTF